MKKNHIITIIDGIIFLANDIFGWFLVLVLSDTGFPNTNQLFSISFQTVLLLSVIHIVISLLVSFLFFLKERTRYQIRITKDLLIYNIIMTLSPYLLFCLYAYYQNHLA